MFAGPRVGHELKVRFNPKSHKVAFDLDGDPRYDLDAMTPGTPQAAPVAIVAPVAQPRPVAKSPAERLEELGRLRDQGLITPEEFQSHRARLLDLL